MTADEAPTHIIDSGSLLKMVETRIRDYEGGPGGGSNHHAALVEIRPVLKRLIRRKQAVRDNR